MDPNFERPVFPKFEAPWVADLPYMLETCRGGRRPNRLCVEKTKHSGQIQPPRTWKPKWTQILIFLFSPNLKPLEKRTCPTCLKLAGEALGILGCVLKRLKILVKFNHRGPGSQNGRKFWSARFPQIWSPLSRGLPYMLETWRGGPTPIRLCVEKTKNFGPIQPLPTWRPKWTQIFINPFSPNVKPLE